MDKILNVFMKTWMTYSPVQHIKNKYSERLKSNIPLLHKSLDFPLEQELLQFKPSAA